MEINTVAEYWGGVNTEVKFIDDQAKKLRDDRRLQMKIKSLNCNWEGVARDHKGYITAVRAILHEQPVLTFFQLDTLLNNNPQYKSLVDSGRAITTMTTKSLNQMTRPEEEKESSMNNYRPIYRI